MIEIVIADGMSTDLTREIISNLINKNTNIPVNLIDNPKHIVSTGLNLALLQAKGEVIIRVDGHCEIAPDYLKQCVQNLHENAVDGVGGPIETIGDTAVAQTIASAMSSFFGVGGSAFRTVKDRSMLVDSVAFPAYNRQTIEKVGLFDEELVCNEDDEYNYRIRKLGGKILLSTDIRSKYYSRGSLRKLWSQFYQYGFWKVRILQKHPRQMRLRQFVPPAFVASLICLGMLAIFFPITRFTFFLLFIMYLIANVFASLYTAAQRGWRHLLPLPLVYAILHISYGLGFMVGLIKFASRWGDKEGKVPTWDQKQLSVNIND